jgi:hypothetical protein
MAHAPIVLRGVSVRIDESFLEKEFLECSSKYYLTCCLPQAAGKFL